MALGSHLRLTCLAHHASKLLFCASPTALPLVSEAVEGTHGLVVQGRLIVQSREDAIYRIRDRALVKFAEQALPRPHREDNRRGIDWRGWQADSHLRKGLRDQGLDAPVVVAVLSGEFTERIPIGPCRKPLCRPPRRNLRRDPVQDIKGRYFGCCGALEAAPVVHSEGGYRQGCILEAVSRSVWLGLTLGA